MYGKPCSCAIKREGLDNDDLTKFATRNTMLHRRAQSYNSKPPAIPTRRSDSVVPKFQNGHHPQLHRYNNAAHDFGHPYPIKRFSRSTDNFDWPSNRSADSLPLPHNGIGMAFQQPLPDITSAPRQDTTSNPRLHSPAFGSEASTPGRPPYLSGSGMNSPVLINSPVAAPNVSSAPRQDYFPSPRLDASGSDLDPPRSNPFTPPIDINFMNSAQSPANPQRYSLNDFSNFNWNDLDNSILSASPASDHMPGSPADFNMDGSLSYNPLNHTPPPRSSIMSSVEHPGMCYSPSASVSDAGDSIANSGDHSMITSVPRQMTPIDASFMTRDYKEPFSGGDLKASTYPGSASPYNQAANRSSATSFDDYLSLPTSAPMPDFKSNHFSDMSQLPGTPPPTNQENTVPVTSGYEAQPRMDQWSLSPSPQGFYSPQPDMSQFGTSGTFS